MKENSRSKNWQPPDRTRTKEMYESRYARYENDLRNLYLQVRTLLEQHGLTPTVKYRVKRFDAYYEKLLRNSRKRKGGPPAITDLFGLRIICPFLEDVDTIEGLLSEHFEVVETVRKAAGHSFREFGYDSVHLLVRLENLDRESLLPHSRPICEIQLRTILQDAWAEVEHELVYKSPLSWPKESVRRKLAALNATLTLSDLTFQEIRDYQKSVMALDRKRRKALENPLSLPQIDWPPPESTPPASPEELPVHHGSPLEKAMMAALTAHSQHRFEEAVAHYSKILGMRMSRKNRALVYNHRGMALFALSRPREALRDFSRAVDYDEEYLRALCNRGLVHRSQKRYARSLEDYSRALEIDPSHGEAWLGRAQTWLKMSFPDQALSDCDKALEITPGNESAANLRRTIQKGFFGV